MQELSIKSGGGRNFGRERNLGRVRGRGVRYLPTLSYNYMNAVMYIYCNRLLSNMHAWVIMRSYNDAQTNY